MPNPIAKPLLLIVDLVCLPLMIASYVLFVVDLSVRLRAARPSITAYSLMYGRWIYDRTGKRPDPACRQLFRALPGVLTWLASLIAAPTLWTMRITGATLFGLTDYPVYTSTSIADYLGQRTRFLDDVLYRSLENVKQVVILGAGWDTRAYNLVQTADVRVYELDTVQMQAAKRKALKDARIDLTGVIFCTADFNKESWLDALKRAGFDPNLPTFVLWEGVSPYMTEAAVDATLQTVATQLAAGSAIAFDYFSRHYVQGGDFSLLPRPFAFAFRWIGEPHVFGLPTEPPARARLAAYLAANGLQLVEFEPIGAGARDTAGTVHSPDDEGHRVDGGLALAVN
jgi:methyltransferase (TIGR00027 family)